MFLYRHTSKGPMRSLIMIDMQPYMRINNSRILLQLQQQDCIFDEELLDEIRKKGVSIAKVNLSVGAGTFQPVKVENIADHNIHSEYMEVKPEIVDLVNATKESGKKVFAVGTTATRALETAFKDMSQKGFNGYTNLYITPGYKFKAVDCLITNFHMPQSSLLMLVAAFIGYENMKEIYKIAVEERYRFLSYGDAMLLQKHEV